jgi:hypothetical protein
MMAGTLRWVLLFNLEIVHVGDIRVLHPSSTNKPVMSCIRPRKALLRKSVIVTDPACHFDADPDPDPSSQIQVQTHKKFSSRLIFHTFWLVICKLMRIRNRIQLITLMRIRSSLSLRSGSGSGSYHSILSGSGSATLGITLQTYKTGFWVMLDIAMFF